MIDEDLPQRAIGSRLSASAASRALDREYLPFQGFKAKVPRPANRSATIRAGPTASRTAETSASSPSRVGLEESPCGQRHRTPPQSGLVTGSGSQRVWRP
jgi:hypothetical protein